MLREDAPRIFGIAVAGILLLAASDWSRAASPETFQQFDAASRFDQALAAVDAIRGRKRLQCILSTASRALCQCLSKNLPLDTYPRSYPAIARQEGEYDALSDSDRAVVRQCVADSRS
jgi:hypothetical protein